jgi:hypothetical protein
MFIAVLFTIAKNCEISPVPQEKKSEVMSFARKWMELEITLNKPSSKGQIAHVLTYGT